LSDLRPQRKKCRYVLGRTVHTTVRPSRQERTGTRVGAHAGNAPADAGTVDGDLYGSQRMREYRPSATRVCLNACGR
jgi:hypothetical protein